MIPQPFMYNFFSFSIHLYPPNFWGSHLFFLTPADPFPQGLTLPRRSSSGVDHYCHIFYPRYCYFWFCGNIAYWPQLFAAMGHTPACSQGQHRQQAEGGIFRAGTSARDIKQEHCRAPLVDISRSAALPSWACWSLRVRHPPGTSRSSWKPP